MEKNWYTIMRTGHLYVIDNDGDVVDFGDAKKFTVEIGNMAVDTIPDVVIEAHPVKIMKNEGASAHSPEREYVAYVALKCANKENLELIEKLKKDNEELKRQNESLQEVKKRLFQDNCLFSHRFERMRLLLNSAYGITGSFKYDIQKVIFNYPATIVLWKDGTKTVVKYNGKDSDGYSPEAGIAMCIAKKLYGNKGNYFNKIKEWIPEDPDSLKPKKTLPPRKRTKKNER